MMSKTKRDAAFRVHTSPWILVGSVGILLTVVIIMAVQNYNREKQHMSRILSEKGAALIKAVEAAARTGMMDMMWEKRQIQTLLEETARLPGVLYLTVVSQDGLVLAHSDKSVTAGSSLNLRVPLNELDAGASGWNIVDSKRFGRAFVVYRYFQPIVAGDNCTDDCTHATARRDPMTCQDNDWSFAAGQDKKDRIILVGLDPKPFEDARQEDIRNTLIISGVLFVLGLAGFISMFWMHSYRSARRSLQDTTAFADKVVTSLPIGLIASDKSGKIAFHNNAAERITGLNLARMQGQDMEAVMPKHFSGLRNALDRGESIYEQEMECEFTENKTVPVSVSISEIINDEGQFVGQVLLLKDIGEVRRLQEEIRRKEKLAAIGGLAAGMAHEIRNPLSSIKGIASYFRSKFEEDSDDKDAADVMIREVDRLNRVISELIDFARPSQITPKNTDLNEFLEHSVRLVQREASAKGVQVQLNLLPQSQTVDIDPDRLSQCLLNLYLNALQSMGHGGQMTVTCSLKGGNTVEIAVQDTGSGIRSENLKQIFDPYFTTKTTGTGLGLAIVHKIIEAHQGQIKVSSTPGHGSVFSIVLPLKTMG